MSRPPTTHELFEELESGRHGHFAEKLAKAWFFADGDNKAKIEANWPHLLKKAAAFVTEPAY